jgi:bifunctional isochorismate lyase/aryl carrier protein
MKRRYFSIDKINQESQIMLARLPRNEGRRGSNFNSTVSALLILDMQSYFLDQNSHAFIPSAEAIVPGLELLARTYYQNDLPVIFTQHLNTPQDAGSMARWWKDLIKDEDPLSAIIPAFDFSNRLALRKSQYDAFYDTSLESTLRRRHVTQVVISGVMTHLCCETTARSAFMRGFEVFFLVDGTATYNEEHHLATLLNLGHGFASLVMVNEVLEAVKKKTKQAVK